MDEQSQDLQFTRDLAAAGEDLQLTDGEYRHIGRMVRDHFGIHLAKEKKALVRNRLHNHVTSMGYASYGDLIEHVESDSSGVELDHLASLISTRHTYFFREAAHFDFLESVVLPELERRARRTSENDLRVWCAAASTGEEAYSILMTMLRFFGPRYATLDAGVLVTDLSTSALRTAAAGIYTADQVKKVPEDLLSSYFRRLEDGRYEVIADLRKELLIRKFNLMAAHYPFKRPFQVIFCRNLMIYFDAGDRRKLVKKLHDVTAPGGYLFVGHSETVDSRDSGFEYVLPAVYRRPL